MCGDFMKYLYHRGIKIPLIGLGSFNIYSDSEAEVINTFIHGINNHELTLIDTAEMYLDSELILSKIIKKVKRERLYIINKILPSNAKANKYLECCKKSLELLGTEYLDLYLLHWRDDVNLEEFVWNMEKLKELGLIKNWGVSNFDISDMEDLFKVKDGNKCFLNQVLYNIKSRGIEYDLIPWCKENDVLIMSYSPLCNNQDERSMVANNKKIIDISRRLNLSPNSLMLSFVIRNNDIITIFKTSSITHLEENLNNVFNKIDDDILKEIDDIFNPPTKKMPLQKI